MGGGVSRQRLDALEPAAQRLLHMLQAQSDTAEASSSYMSTVDIVRDKEELGASNAMYDQGSHMILRERDNAAEELASRVPHMRKGGRPGTIKIRGFGGKPIVPVNIMGGGQQDVDLKSTLKHSRRARIISTRMVIDREGRELHREFEVTDGVDVAWLKSVPKPLETEFLFGAFRRDFKQRLQQFYERAAPGKLGNVGQLAHKYAGKEEQLIEHLGYKYPVGGRASGVA